MDLELDDVGPSLGRGPVLFATRADDFSAVTIRAHLSDPRPIELVESFLAEVRFRLALER